MRDATLILALTAIQQCCFLLLWLGLAVARLERATVLHFAVAAVAIASNGALITLRTELPPWAGFGLASILGTLGYTTVRRGLQRFARRPPTDREHLAVLLIATPLFLWASVAADLRTNVIAVTAVYVFVLGRTAWEMRVLRQEFGLPLTLACVFPVALLVTMQGARLIGALLGQIAPGVRPDAADGLPTGPLLVMMAASLLAHVLMMGMLMTRLLRQLTEQNARDPLTSLYNRRAFQRVWERAARRLTNDGAGYCLISIDIDHFKAVNDRFGHPAGDSVLCAVADALRHASRDGDMVARSGGEEFTIVLPRATLEDAQHVAERIRQTIAEWRTNVRIPGDGTLRVTASLGVAAVTSADEPMRSVAHRLDGALYQAKRNGRNRVETAAAFEPSGTPGSTGPTSTTGMPLVNAGSTGSAPGAL